MRENYEKGQMVSKHKENMNTEKYMAQKKNMAPEYIDIPKMTGIQVPFYPDPLMKPPPKLPDTETQSDRQVDLDLDLGINKDFEENSPYQEGIISEIYQRPDESQEVEPPELIDLVDTNNKVQKYLPKQTDIDKILKIIQRKVLKRYPSPCHNKRYMSRIFK